MQRLIALIIGLAATLGSDIFSSSSFEGVVLPLLATCAFLYLLITSIDRRMAAASRGDALPLAGITLSDGCGSLGDSYGGDAGGGDGGC